jgi:hypothetical protein
MTTILLDERGDVAGTWRGVPRPIDRARVPRLAFDRLLLFYIAVRSAICIDQPERRDGRTDGDQRRRLDDAASDPGNPTDRANDTNVF